MDQPERDQPLTWNNAVDANGSTMRSMPKQAPSPTPDPVAWMVVDSQGVPRGVRLLESNARYDAMNAKFANVVPLYVQPSALPATAPSGLFTEDDLAILFVAYRSAMNAGAEREAEAINFLRERVVRCIVKDRSPVSPSEGSAPDTPTDDEAEFAATWARIQDVPPSAPDTKPGANALLKDALNIAWAHLHRLDPVLTEELCRETPALREALEIARRR